MKLEEVPYLACVPQDGRVLLFQPWYDVDSQVWHCYALISPDNYIRMQMRSFAIAEAVALRAFLL